jgi:protein farnesyltransferase/geranylgeranyltransferase type-1 subunit alpha
MVYAGAQEWADVQPIPQDDGENPVVPINYSAECKPCTDHP